MLYTPNKQLQGFQALKLHSTKGKDTTKFLQLGLQQRTNQKLDSCILPFQQRRSGPSENLNYKILPKVSTKT